MRLAIVATLLITELGCFRGKGEILRRGGTSQNSKLSVATTDSNGVTVATISSKSTMTQEVKAGEKSSASGTIVSFPPGSLAIDTEIKIDESVVLTSAAFSAQLGIDGTVTAAGKPVTVQSLSDAQVLQPFTISIAVSNGGTQLADSNFLSRLIVLYKGRDITTNAVVAGAVPPSELTLSNGTVTFSTHVFGAFQPVLTVQPMVSAPKQITLPEAKILTKREAVVLPTIAIASRTPFITSAGNRVTIKGANFRPSMLLAMGGKPVTELRVASDTVATFNTPSYQGFGLATLTAEQDGTEQQISLMYNGSATDYPVYAALPADICSPTKFYDAQGSLQTGTRNCTIPPTCTADGQSGCVTTTQYLSADTNGLAAKIASGMTVAGITGIAGVESHSNCTTDGGLGCVTVSAYPAAKLSNFTAANIQSGVTVAGIAGSLANCAADGATNCVAVTSHTAAATSGLANKILSGNTVAGIIGNVTLPNPVNVRTVNGNFGVGGTATTPSLPDCASDGQQNCYASGVFKAANITGISPWDIRFGLSLGGITGGLKTNCRNTVNSTYYNHDTIGSLTNTADTSGSAFDHWDTVDDYYGLSSNTVAGWALETYCDATTFTDVTTTNGGSSTVTCGTSSTCIYMDNISKLRVTGVLGSGGNITNTTTPATFTWLAAVQACASSTYGGYPAGSWRLPTQKELMSLYQHGITSLNSANFASLTNMRAYVWSSTTKPDAPINARNMFLASGGTSWDDKSLSYYAVCVR